VGPLTLTSAGPKVVPDALSRVIGAPAYNSTTLDAAGEYVAQIIKVGPSTTFRTFQLAISSVSGSPTGDFAFEAVDATTGLPSASQTLFATNTNLNGVTVTAGWFSPGNFTADCVVSNSYVAAVLRYASGTNIVTRHPLNTNLRTQQQYGATNTGTPAKSSPGAFAFQKSDGTYPFIPHSYPNVDGTLSEAFDDTPGPNHRGNVYTAEVPQRCFGGWFVLNSAVDCDYVIAVDGWDGTADNDGTSNIAVTIDKDFQTAAAVSTGTPIFIISDKTLDFAAGQDYRSVVKATVAGTNVTIYRIQVDSSAILNQITGHGTALRYTSAQNPTGAGDWTDVNTKIAFNGFWCDQFDDASGGGGGLLTHPGMSGGFRG
jgi:hypothetical protein